MKRVIVVDDEPFILMIIEDKLKNAGYDVITQRTSNNIIKLIKSRKPNLIIMDWMLPERSGLDICKKLKKDPSTRLIPIFMLTAKGEETDKELVFQCGIEQYITKPFSPRTLLNLVKETIGMP